MSTANSEKTGNLTSYQPGQSGNPSGRPKIDDSFRAKCRIFMEADGWDKIIEIVKDEKHRDRFRALELITAYAYGKPRQDVELTGEVGVTIIDDIPVGDE